METVKVKVKLEMTVGEIVVSSWETIPENELEKFKRLVNKVKDCEITSILSVEEFTIKQLKEIK